MFSYRGVNVHCCIYNIFNYTKLLQLDLNQKNRDASVLHLLLFCVGGYIPDVSVKIFKHKN